MLKFRSKLNIIISLNPCFGGIYSRSPSNTVYFIKKNDVLILVLVEYTLEGVYFLSFFLGVFSLNPCFGGIYSRRALKQIVTMLVVMS